VSLLRLLVAILLSSLSPLVFAQAGNTSQQLPDQRYCYTMDSFPAGRCYASVGDAASAYAQENTRVNEYGVPRTVTVVSAPDIPAGGNSVAVKFHSKYTYPTYVSEDDFSVSATRYGQTTCPANSVSSGGHCYCSEGFKPSGGVCVPSAGPCDAKKGTSEYLNFTIGYSRTSGKGEESAWEAHIIQRGLDMNGARVCDGQCSGTAAFGPDTKSWQGTEPNTQGLYRVSVDYRVTYDGSTCKPADKTPAMDSSAEGGKCDGYVGQINNKTVCVGKQGTADTSISAPTPIQSGNPAAGSNGSSSLPSRTGGAGDSAGGPASPGDGSIRGGSGSPTNGSGGTGGGGGAVGGSTEIKIETCGGSGQPPCKIDESGTPGGQGAYNGANSALDGAMTGLDSAIRGAGNRSSLPWSPSELLLPSASCEVQRTETRLGPLTFDACSSPIAQLWRQLLGWLLYMYTLLYAWRTAGGSIGNGGR